MQLFYDPEISKLSTKLPYEEAQHCIRVLRKKEGDGIHITNGVGDLYVAIIESIEGKHCNIRVEEQLYLNTCTKSALHIAIAPTKNTNRFEWFLEKATEIGIGQITPIYCSHSERRVLKIDRFKKILLSAMKQSQKLFLPHLNEPCMFNDFVNNVSEKYESKYIANYNKDNFDLKDEINSSSGKLVLIGPEGDFSIEELNLASNKGFISVNLGKYRLRTETAGLVVCTIDSYFNNKCENK